MKMNSSQPAEPSLKILLTHFNWTIDRFEEILQNEKTDYYRDAAFQRFSFTCDMAMKCIRSLAADQGRTCKTFQQCVEWAVEKNWVEEKSPWKEMTELYDQTAQKLNDESANLEYEKLESHSRLLKNIYEHMRTL
jgi:Nucleotidyltransferase substrate binding protein like